MVTIKDVARTAEVSVATVSRVYNGFPGVREETRKRVLGVGRKLGYSPHGAAQSLVTNRTHTIGVLLPDLYGEFFSELIRGIDEAVQGTGFHVLLSSARRPADSLEPVLRSMRGRVDGLILMAPELESTTARSTLPIRIPIVLVNSPPSDVALPSIGVANAEGAHAMVRHLAGLGHRRIGMIRGAEHNFDAAERLRGYRQAVAELGLVADPALEVPGDFTEAAGHAAAQRLLALAHRPTAIFAANDGMAIGVLSALSDAGVRVPEAIAVAGFDDIPMARYAHPALTSVHVDIIDLGRRATVRLLGALAGRANGAPERDTLATTLVLRRSCGARSDPA